MNIKRLISIFILIILLGLYLAQDSFSQSSQVNVITIDNYIINPVIAEYVSSAIDRTTGDASQCLIIQLDTPGGLLESTRQIVKKMMNANIPIVVYIAPSGSRAGSAGVFITLASHIAAMAPSTNIGAAHPVMLGKKERSLGEEIKEIIQALKSKKENQDSKKNEVKEEPPEKEEEPMTQKIMNDTIAWVTTIAQTRGRNIDWAKKAVTESVSATENEAIKENIINLVAADLNDLMAKVDGMAVNTKSKTFVLATKDANLNYIDLSPRQKILNTIINPTIAYILMMLGFYGLLFEFTHPGIGFPGIAGLICIILAFYAFQTLPINYAGMALIILAVILFIAEALTPTFGLLTLGGITAMVLGSIMLVDSPHSFMRVSLKVILPFVIATGTIVIFLVGNVIKAHRKKVTTGKEGLIGKVATATTDVDNKTGQVFCHGEIWTARSDTPIKKDQEVIVKKVEGLTLIVGPIKDSANLK